MEDTADTKGEEVKDASKSEEAVFAVVSREESHEAQDIRAITDNLSEAVEKFNASLEEYLKDIKKEIGYATKTLETSTALFEGITREQLGLLTQKVAELAEENFSLRKLPEKIAEPMRGLVPDISNEVVTRVFKDYEAAIAASTEKIRVLDEKLLPIVKRVEKVETLGAKKRLISLVSAVIISVCTSGVLTYSLVRTLPKIVSIDTTGEIKIDGGKVSIWDMSKRPGQGKKTK